MKKFTPEFKREKIDYFLLFITFVWAANYPIIKYGISGLNIFIFNAVRFITASIVLAIIFVVREKWIKIPKNDWFKFIGIGLLANVLYQVAFITGVNMTTAGNAAVILSTSPLWTAFIQSKIYKYKIELITYTGLFISLIGIIFIITGSGKQIEFGSKALVGDIICLFAALFWSLQTNLQKPVLTKYPPVQLTLITTIVGAIGLSGLSLPYAMNLKFTSISFGYYLAAIISGVFAIAISNLLWSYGIKNIGAGRTSNYQNLVPILAIIISHIALNEKILFIQIVGAIITVFGVYLARK
ncbi:MAG: Permease of the drug/metabolite transporter (DMT) superfamily [Ignavibacteriae bacterium]|nr:MAG: Permease of the drug/metabolite transporter (DMT) superfamily [Ignavibacteriota bacterium]